MVHRRKEKPLDFEGFSAWVIQDANTLDISGEKHGVGGEGAAKIAANRDDFAEAVSAIMGLPLTEWRERNKTIPPQSCSILIRRCNGHCT